MYLIRNVNPFHDYKHALCILNLRDIYKLFYSKYIYHNRKHLNINNIKMSF